MIYIPGIIHESFQKSHYYLLKSNFFWSNCTKRYSEFNEISDWDNFTHTIELLEGDIIQVKFFKFNQVYNTYKFSQDAHCYLEKVIRRDGSEEIYNTESTTSLNFLEHNIGNEKLFQSADRIINRDNIIDTLLK